MTDTPDHNHDHSDTPFQGFTIDQIQKNFKSLAQELTDADGQSLSEVLNEIHDDDQEIEETLTQPPFFRGYNPTIKDFLARAQTEEQCREIIAYCLSKGEITQDEADHLSYRLEKGGPRAFGTRSPGYYDRKL